ncbi:MAG TPA: hypothetical protein VK806_06470 [Bacteroidia bacterium]|jgi:hypothetical protein|nr:hypothetical protein [Bacteroidia bacterium]
MKKLILTFSLFAFIFSLCSAQHDSTMAFHYKTDKYDCAIFSKKFTDAYTGGKHFSPNRDDVDKAEYAIAQKLLLQTDTTRQIGFIYRNLKKYQRQYFGYVANNGHKVLYISLLWTEDKASMKDWLTNVVEIDGGGAYYWKIKYDMDSNTLYDLKINNQE